MAVGSGPCIAGAGSLICGHSVQTGEGMSKSHNLRVKTNLGHWLGRVWQVLALALLSAATQAGTLGTPTLTPDRVVAGVATAVTVSVSITDPNYLAGSANLQRLRGDGGVQAVVGLLRDDGRDGDAVAGDKIYTLRTLLTEATAGTVKFQVSAGFRRELKRTTAGPLTLTVDSAVPAPVIGAVSMAPASTAAGVAVISTVTAVITDSSLVPGSVVLQKLGAGGQVLGTLGVLHDDGLVGDAVAGDKIYSLRTTVLENNPGTVNYRVAASFTGYGAVVYSAPLSTLITGTATGVAISSPANGAYLNTPVITLSGTVGDGAAQVSINGITTPVSGGGFAASVPLNEGPNTLTAVASNSNGTTSTASILVTLDTTAPRVEIYSPAAGGSTTAGEVTVTGLVNDIVVGTVNSQQATVTVNGVVAQVLNRSFMASNVPLSVGANSVQAVATDRAGNRATTTVNITRAAANQAGLAVVSGNNQSAAAGASLAAPLVARLVDSQGNPQVNKPVVFRVIALDGRVSPSGAAGTGLSAVAVNTDAQGRAQVFYTLGSRAGAGNNLVEASTSGLATTADFAASATPGGATLVVVDSGNNQSGVVGQALPLPFIAIVTDARNNRLANVPVTFAVRNGGGSFAGPAGPVTTLQTVSDADGRIAARLILGPDQGINNNLVEALLPGSASFPAAFSANGLIPGPADQTRISGVVLDNSNNAIPGVTMRLLQITQGNRSNIPQEVAPAVRTDAQGQFVMTQVPVGIFKLMADGGTAQRAGSWPTLDYDMITVSGQNNTIGMPIYLPELNPNNRVCVNESTGGTVTIPEAPGFALTIAPGSATFPGGSRTGCVSVTPVNMDKVPMSPGFGQQPRFIVTIQPVGTHFNPPARMTIPNVDGLAPRAVTEMYSYDHDLASFVAIGSATVSEDGSTITSDPGSGVIKAGWHCGGDPATAGTVADCPDCKICDGIVCVTDPAKEAQYCDTGPKICIAGVCTPITLELLVGNAVITLLNSNDLKAKVVPAAAKPKITEYKFEVRRATEAIWYELQKGGTEAYTNKAKVAGKFKVRLTATLSNGSVLTSPEKDLEVQFPSYADISADADVVTATDAAWTATKGDATAVQRRERGFWIKINTDTEKYEFSATDFGAWVGDLQTGSVNLSAKPADVPATPTPLEKPTYTVASFHTHTPTFYRSVGRAVGPSGADGTADTADNVAGVVYDYVGDAAGNAPAAWPLNSPAQRYHSGPTRRTTPP